MNKLSLPETVISRAIDGALEAMGRHISWLWLILLAVIVVNVVMRYWFDEGHIELEELQWHLYSVGFLLGLSYTYQADGHVRVDVVLVKLSARNRAWLELYGILLALLPFIVLIIWYGIPFVVLSYELSEISQAPGGLPYRWFVKAFLPLSFLLLLLAALSRLTRLFVFLFGSSYHPEGNHESR